MVRTSNIDVRLRLRDARTFQAEMARARGAVTTFGSAGVNALRRFAAQGARLRSIGRTMTFGVTLPIVGGAALATRASIQFSDQINQIGTQAGASEVQVARYRDAIMEYAASGASSEGPEALADSMFRVVSGGFEGAEAIDVMRKSEELATVGRANLEASTLALVGAVNTGIEGTEDLDEAIGTLNATVGAGSLRMEDLASAMGTGVLGQLAPLGISLRDVGAALGVLTGQGMPANQASTRLVSAMAQLTSVTPDAASALEALGLGEKTLARQMQREGMLPAIETLRDRLAELDDVDRNKAIMDIFGRRSAGAIIPLINNFDKLNRTWRQIGEEALTFDEALESVNAEPATNLQQAMAQLRTVLIAIGDEIMPKVVPLLVDLAAGVRDAFTWFTELPDPVQKVAIGLVIAAAALGPMIFLLGVMASSIGSIIALAGAIRGLNLAFMANPAVLVVVALVAIGLAIYTLYNEVEWFRDMVDAAFDWIVGAAGWVGAAFINMKDWVTTAVGDIIDWISGNWPLVLAIITGPIGLAVLAVVSNFDRIKGAASSVLDWITTAFNNVVDFIKGMPGRIANAATGMWDGIKQAFRSAINFIIRGWNSLELRIPDISMPGPIPDIPGFGVSTPNIPELAQGGTIMSPGSAWIAEDGPELVSLPRGAQVAPLDSDFAEGLRGAIREIVLRAYLQVDGRTLAEATAIAVADDEARR